MSNQHDEITLFYCVGREYSHNKGYLRGNHHNLGKNGEKEFVFIYYIYPIIKIHKQFLLKIEILWWLYRLYPLIKP